MKKINGHVLFKSFDLSVFSGEWVGIVGKNGSGKTTLAKIICGLDVANEGTIFFNGQSQRSFYEREWVKKIQLITQYTRHALDPTKTIKKILLEPINRFGLATHPDEEEKIQQILLDCQLPEKILTKYPKELSGGEYQRICVALALLVQPEVLICDETTANLDKISELRILKLLKQKEQMSVIFISHDRLLVKKYCDRFVELV